MLPASASADKSVPELWGREGWDTGPQARCFARGGRTHDWEFVLSN